MLLDTDVSLLTRLNRLEKREEIYDCTIKKRSSLDEETIFIIMSFSHFYPNHEHNK